MGKIKNEKAARRPQVNLWRHSNVKMTSSCRISEYSRFLEVFYMFFQYENELFSGKQEKESIIGVRMG